MTVPNFLGEEQVKLPVGGDFVASGLIAAWFAQVGFSFWSEANLSEIDGAPAPTNSRKMGRGYTYFFRSYDDGKMAGELVGQQYPPKQTWQWQCKKDTIKNIADEETLAKFSDVLFQELEISTLKSKKRRHEMHLIALPAAVAAMARVYGYDTPGFDLSELLRQDAIFTDEFQVKMIGTGDDFSAGLLWQRRADLWKSLGEEDPTKYNCIGTGTKFDTASEKLSNCLAVLGKAWKAPVWAQLVNVPSPVVDATYKKDDESKRLTIAALVTIFENEKAATAQAEKELEAREQNTATTPTNGNGKSAGASSAEPPIPSQWKDSADDWRKYVPDLKKQVAGKPLPIVKKFLKEHEGELAATVDEVLPWLAV